MLFEKENKEKKSKEKNRVEKKDLPEFGHTPLSVMYLCDVVSLSLSLSLTLSLSLPLNCIQMYGARIRETFMRVVLSS